MNSSEQYLTLYHTQRTLLSAHSPAPVDNARDEAARLLSRQGLPTHREERYKYTDANEAFAPDFGLNLRRIPAKVNPYEAYRCGVPGLSTALYFVVNDVPFAPTPEATSLLPEGAFVASFQSVQQSHPHLLAAYYNQLAADDRDFRHGHDGTTLLNTLLATDGLMVYLPKATRATHPIQIVSVTTPPADQMSVRRIIIVAEEGAKADILLCDHSGTTDPAITTQVVETYAAKNADLHIYNIEETNEKATRFANHYIRQAENSHVLFHSVALTCGISRTRVDVRLVGSEARTELYGAVIADSHQRADNNLLVEHLVPGGTSQMLYKYVLDGQSTGAFAGKVYVAPGAGQTTSEQTNANLCASPTARAYSQPMLEIYADDVKCNHGSTIGKLDDAALFYMRQRGIPETEARLLLQHAFVNEVLQYVGIDQLRDRLSALVSQRFRGGLQKCQGCRGCGC